MTMSTHAVARMGALVLVAVLGAGPARADMKQECVAAYEQTQTLRNAGQLRRAREQVLICAQDQCPSFVKKDCAQWMPEIESSTPTVVFEAIDASGGETDEVRVTFDGELLKERLDGKAVPLDPGRHVIRYELEGSPPKEETIIIREGEKNRKLSVSFAIGGAGAKKEEEMTTPPGGVGGDQAAVSGSGVPMLAYVLGGVGVLGVGMFATFGLLGAGQKSDLEETCAPKCSDDDVSSVRNKLIVADVSLGVGAVALGVATYLFVTAPSSPSAASSDAAKKRRAPPLAFDVRPTQGGGFASVGGRF